MSGSPALRRGPQRTVHDAGGIATRQVERAGVVRGAEASERRPGDLGARVIVEDQRAVLRREAICNVLQQASDGLE